MKFIRVNRKQFRNFTFNSELSSYGISDGVTDKTYNGKDCIAIRLLFGDEKCFVRKDFIKFCK